MCIYIYIYIYIYDISHLRVKGLTMSNMFSKTSYGNMDFTPIIQEDPWRGPWGGLLYWGTRKMRFLRDMQNAL